MQLTISKDELYTMMKSAVREVLQEKTAQHFLNTLAPVSDEEMKDIEETFGTKPKKTRDIAFSETIDQ